MAVKLRSSGYGTSSTTHVVEMPPGTEPGDKVIVGFVNDNATTVATPSAGWTDWGSQEQGSTTNHRLTVFIRTLDGTSADTLTVTLTDDTNSPTQEAAWVVVALWGWTTQWLIGVEFANGGNATAADVPATPTTSDDWDSIVFLALDNNGEPGHPITSAPSGYGAVTSPGDNTPGVTIYEVDQRFEGSAGGPASTWSWTNQDQWITAHIITNGKAPPEPETHRFYLSNSPADLVPGSKSPWVHDLDEEANARQLTGSPEGSPATVSVSESSTETPYYMLMGQWVSHPASGPGVLEFDHQVAWSMAESNSAADMHPYTLVYVLRDEANLAGVAINRWYSAGAAELPTSHQGRLLAPGAQLSGEGPVPFQAGDRIVIEAIVRANNSSATTYTATMRVGGTSSTPLGVNDTDPNRSGWIDLNISSNEPVTFGPPPAVEGSGSASITFAAAASGTATSDISGTASASVSFAAAADGVVISGPQGNGSASITFAATADGVVDTPPTGEGGLDAWFEAAAIGVSLPPPTPAEPGPANPGEALWIGPEAGKNHFNIGIGDADGDGHTDTDQDEIAEGFTSEPEFKLTPDRSAVHFQIGVDAGRTSAGASYPRCELRELDLTGERAAWNGSTGTHYMRGRSRVTHVAAEKPWVALFQIHGASDDLCRVQVEDGGSGPTGLRLRARRTPVGGGSEQRYVVKESYTLGEWIDWEIRVDSGTLRVLINDATVLNIPGGAATPGLYFKAGCYAQSNTSTELGDSSQYFSVEIEAGSFQCWHTGYPEPTEPVFSGTPGAVLGVALAPVQFGGQAEAVVSSKPRVRSDFTFSAAAEGVPTTFASSARTPLTFSAIAIGPGLTIGEAATPLTFGAEVAEATIVERPGVPFLANELRGAGVAVEIAWGADLNADASTWTWTDITEDVRQDPGISTKLGRANEAATTQPAQCTMVLDNSERRYSLGGISPNWPYVRRNTPVRVSIDPDGSGFKPVFFGFADGFTPGWDAMDGRSPVVTLSASGTLRRLEQGSAPVMSAYRRAMISNPTVVAYWPFEEGRNAAKAIPVRGGSPMTSPIIEHEFGSANNFDCSAPLVTLRSNDSVEEAFFATVDPYPYTGGNQVRWLMAIPREGLPHGCFIMDVRTSGTAARWVVTYSTVGGAGALNMTVYSDSGSVLQETFDIQFGGNGDDVRASLELMQNGSDVEWFLRTLGVGESQGGSYTRKVTGRTVGTVTGIYVGGNDADGLVVGHVTVQNQQTNPFEESGPLNAFVGEWPSTGAVEFSRLHRICAEHNVKVTRHLAPVSSTQGQITSNEQMGPQLVAPLLDLLREVEATDQGILWDGLDDGLSYTVRRRREWGGVALTIDAANGELAEPFEPVDDDAETVNRAEASILQGVTALYEDTDGPLGTNTIGIYDTTIEVNARDDEMAIHYAAWRVHVGTVEGYRFPAVTVDLRAAPQHAKAVLDVIPGDRIKVINLPDVFASFGIEDADLEVQGISHEISPTKWRVTFQCGPYSPWGIAQVAAETGDDSEFAWRLDTDGSVTTADNPVGDIYIGVTSTGPVWTTDEDDYPMWLDAGGVRIRAVGSLPPEGQFQNLVVDPLPVPIPAGTPVKLWNPRPIGL